MKIKTFSFLVSDFKGIGSTIVYDPNCNYKRTLQLFDNEEIDKTINKFIKDKEVVSINITTETVHRHNNGRGDTLQRTYTIMYK